MLTIVFIESLRVKMCSKNLHLLMTNDPLQTCVTEVHFEAHLILSYLKLSKGKHMSGWLFSSFIISSYYFLHFSP